MVSPRNVGLGYQEGAVEDEKGGSEENNSDGVQGTSKVRTMVTHRRTEELDRG